MARSVLKLDIRRRTVDIRQYPSVFTIVKKGDLLKILQSPKPPLQSEGNSPVRGNVCDSRQKGSRLPEEKVAKQSFDGRVWLIFVP